MDGDVGCFLCEVFSSFPDVLQMKVTRLADCSYMLIKINSFCQMLLLRFLQILKV